MRRLSFSSSSSSFFWFFLFFLSSSYFSFATFSFPLSFCARVSLSSSLSLARSLARSLFLSTTSRFAASSLPPLDPVSCTLLSPLLLTSSSRMPLRDWPVYGARNSDPHLRGSQFLRDPTFFPLFAFSSFASCIVRPVLPVPPLLL